MGRATTIKVSKETWKLLTAEKLLSDADSLDDVLKSILRRQKAKKDSLYGMLGI